MPVLAADAPEWMRILYNDIEATGSITKTANRIGVDRSGISQIIHMPAGSNYANGKASPTRLIEKIMSTIGVVVCPFLTGENGTDQRITGLQCREFAYRANPPTNSPREVRHWRACQGCDKRVKPAAAAVKSVDAVQTQQAGVIDKVTLPLPEVGAPQIAAQGESA
jgi:hypothetical protein